MSRVPHRTGLWVGVLVAAALGVAPGAPASVTDAGGRVYGVAGSGGLPAAALADGTIVGGSGSLWRLRPRDLRAHTLPLATADTQLDLFGAARDGGLLLGGPTGDIWHRAPAGAMTLLAGFADGDLTPFEERKLHGDGLPATSAYACATAAAAQPDGGVLWVDGRVALRRVGPDGISTTVLTFADEGHLGYCPYDVAPGRRIEDLTVTPAGTPFLLVAEPGGGHAIWQVDADGTARRVRDATSVYAIEATADGALLLSGSRVARWRPGDRTATTLLDDAPRRHDPVFDDEGRRAADVEARFGDGGAVPSPDGGALVPAEASDDPMGQLLYVAPAKPRRLAVALQPRRSVATARGYRAAFYVTRPGLARLTVIDAARHVVAAVSRRVGAGLAHVTLARRLALGAYTVDVTVTGAGGARALDRQGLYLGGTLAGARGRDLLVPADEDLAGCPYAAALEPPSARAADCLSDWTRVTPGACRLSGARQLTCAWSYRDGRDRVCLAGALRLTNAGSVLRRSAVDIACPRDDARPAPPRLGFPATDTEEQVPNALAPSGDA